MAEPESMNPEICGAKGSYGTCTKPVGHQETDKSPHETLFGVSVVKWGHVHVPALMRPSR